MCFRLFCVFCGFFFVCFFKLFFYFFNGCGCSDDLPELNRYHVAAGDWK